jgi:D-alanyl-lipoteichoic acid acyltransferase DltB (MBOAT superfamily)
VPRKVTWDKIGSGAVLVLIGLTRKMAVADACAPLVDQIFSHPKDHGSLMLLQGVFLFALQIYGDFAGYTDIARGVSRMMGIELIENFRRPYFSTNVQDFWSRWHISLSRWLRSYLYIPLGGNRGPIWFVCRNLMLTMLLGGLWHGASWNFVIWGGLHGIALVIHRFWSRRPNKSSAPEAPAVRRFKALLSWALTMLLVGAAWVFFRAGSFSTAWAVFSGIAACRHEVGFSLNAFLRPVLLATLPLLFIDIPQELSGEHEIMRRWPWVLQAVSYFGLLLAIMVLRANVEVPFIYFRF